MRTGGTLLAAALALSACGGDDPAEPTVLSIVLTAPKQTISVGESVQFTATARDVNGVTLPGVTFTFASSPSSVLSVSADGRGIGLTAGAASVTALSSGVSSQPFQVTVVPSASIGAVVTMPNTTFSPGTSTIRVGQSVAFDFPALAHNVTFDNRAGSPPNIPTTMNATVTREFSAAGTFPFQCTIHPGMNGQVVVNP